MHCMVANECHNCHCHFSRRGGEIVAQAMTTAIHNVFSNDHKLTTSLPNLVTPSVSFIDNELFDSCFSLDKTEMDGLCIMNSFRKSHESQLGSPLSMSDITCSMIDEVYKRSDDYIVHFDNNFMSLSSQMSDYFENGNYRSNFGDIVPVIISRAFDCKLNIVHLDSLKHGKLRVSNIVNPLLHNPSEIYIVKNGAHYDALKPL